MPEPSEAMQELSRCETAVSKVSDSLHAVILAASELRSLGLLDPLGEEAYHDQLAEASQIMGVMALNIGYDYINGKLPENNPLVVHRSELEHADQMTTGQWATLFVMRAVQAVNEHLSEAED